MGKRLQEKELPENKKRKFRDLRVILCKQRTFALRSLWVRGVMGYACTCEEEFNSL